ncbi:hypothetical protein [Streptomyces sp. NPDC001635]
MTDAPHRPFDPYAFPAELLEAQRKVAGLFAELNAYQATLPWCREPHPGWPAEEERGKERRGREATPGWTAEQAARFDALFEELRKATAAVQCDGWWERCDQGGIKGGDLVAVRQALKHVHEGVPAAA